MFIRKFMEDASYNSDFLRWPWYKNDVLIGNALPFAIGEKLFGFAVCIEQLPTEAIHTLSTQFVAEIGQSEKSGSDLHRKLAAVFSSHRSFQCFHHQSRHAAVITKTLGTIMKWNAGGFAEILV